MPAACRISPWSIIAYCMTLLIAGAALAQEFPVKPLRIVTTGIGSGSDIAARVIAQALTGPLGQQVIVDPRGNGVVPGQTVAQAAADGYTLLINGTSLWIGTLFQNTGYDPIKDFSAISWILKQPNVLAMHPSLPVKSVRELLALAKSRPGELNYASSATGSSSHLAAELFKALSGTNITRISYTAGASQIADLLGGHVQLMFATSALVSSHLKSGRLKALGVTSLESSALLPGLPSIASAGVPGYESVGMTGFFAPAKTPSSIVNRLNQEVVRVLRLPDVKEKLFNAGVETVGSSPEELANKIKSELARLGKVIKDAGIKGE
jgi:tripartite-type tricarboxylate transporter receptor subunit TctC